MLTTPATLSGLRWLARQAWIRRGIRNRVVDGLYVADPNVPQPFVTALWDLEFAGDMRNLLDRTIYFFGPYEQEVLAVMARWLSTRPDAVALDVGANVGHHTMFLARLCRQVHAFEPFAPVRERLLDNLSRNNMANCRVHGVGLSSRSATAAFTPPNAENLGGGHVAESDRDGTVAIELRRGDDAMDSLGRPDIALIKCDVEGHESFVLEGLAVTLRRSRPALIVELSERTRTHLPTLNALFRLLPDDYAGFDLIGRRVILGLFERPAVRLSPIGGRFLGENVLLVPREHAAVFQDLL